MQEIKAIIRPFKLDEVITALHKIEGLPGVTISDIRGFGKSKAKDVTDAFQEGLHHYVKMVKLELVVHNDIVDKVVDTILQIAHTGNPGDGKIFVTDVKETVKIRTNERGEKAI
jgi:nitrogen regulatory protein P-II 1